MILCNNNSPIDKLLDSQWLQLSLYKAMDLDALFTLL